MPVEDVLHGAYFDLQPSDQPQMLAPNLISTALVEYNGTFSPNGDEFFYTVEVAGNARIAYCQLKANNEWSKPELVPFSSSYAEYDPLFSPDGNRLYFSSHRPIDSSAQGNRSNIWYVEKNAQGWGSPQYVELSDQGDYYSSLTQEGTMYYNIWNTGKILRATPSDTGYVSEELPDIINSRSDVGDPFISPEGDYLIFRAYFNGGFGRGDLYISFHLGGTWTEPENLGEPINSSAHEICPYVSTDGKLFIFASDRLINYNPGIKMSDLLNKQRSYDNGNSNIYYMSADFIQRLKKKHLKTE